MLTPGSKGNCCSNCKWADKAKHCSFYDDSLARNPTGELAEARADLKAQKLREKAEAEKEDA
jgi:hypothetical protein